MSNDPALQAAAALRRIARDEKLKAQVIANKALHDTLLRAALRFIGGETLGECAQAVVALNRQGFAATVDFMGESTRDEKMALEVMQEFLRVVAIIAESRLDASLSLDLSHIGLATDKDLAYRNALQIAQATRAAGIEMMISMEGSERTDAILDLHERLCQRFDHIGITLQAYLYRSQDDLATLLQRPGRIRLVKGAYAEPESKALARGDELNAAYVALLETLLVSGHACSIASHDPELLGHAHRFISERDVRREPIEFEMLYGVTPERLEEKLRQGYRTRVYMVYGVEWYLYLCHRLAEHPPNIFRAITDIVGIEQH